MKIFAGYGGPPVIKGLVRDIRPVWALEECGADYEFHWLNIGEGEQRGEANMAINPFGKVPSMQDGDVTMFESGAICLYIADKYECLGGPSGSASWNKVLQWSFAALDTVVPPLFDHFIWSNFRTDNPAQENAVKAAKETADMRLGLLDGVLEGRDFLVGEEITVADILMGAGLRNALNPDIIGKHANVRRYMDGLYVRPAFKRAYDLNLRGPA